MTVHAFSEAGFAILREQARLIILSDEIVQVVIGFEDHVATAPAVATAGPAFGPVFLTLKRDAAFAAVTGAGIHFDFVNKHGNEKGEAEGLAMKL